MKPSADAYNLVKASEGLRLTAYPDPGSGGSPWTIGWGSTRNVTRSMTINLGEAQARLVNDLETAANIVSGAVKVNLSQNQFDALCDFAFNVGAGQFNASTLVKKLNAGDYAGAAAEFPKWNKAGGKVMNGLVTRRARGLALFEGRGA